jgi:hypothetical protein
MLVNRVVSLKLSVEQEMSNNDARAPIALREESELETKEYHGRNSSYISPLWTRVGSLTRTDVVLETITNHKGCKRANGTRRWVLKYGLTDRTRRHCEFRKVTSCFCHSMSPSDSKSKG